ncbi:pectinesterase inhibitor 7-like [Salvia divinorum]|uniref:Pectinesterase inhibitor 7-like n=1 Tax=Salvia divinorum TaxID=28513 RepID=A0ABD1HJB4_SALDI
MRSLGLTFLVISIFLTAASAAGVLAPAPAPVSSAEFIRASCENTMFPELCYQTLKGYANVVKKDLARLVKVSIGLTLTRAKFMSAYVENLIRQAQPEPPAATLLSVCVECYRDAEFYWRDSSKLMQRLSGNRKELRDQLNKVLSRISPVPTNEDDCTDAIESISDPALKAAVFGRADEARKGAFITFDLVATIVRQAEPMVP